MGQFPPELQRCIDAEFTCLDPDVVMRSQELSSKIRAVVTRSSYRVPSELIQRLPALEIIATSGVGYDGIPLEETRSRGIAVTNTPGILDAAVCELGVGLMLAMLRQIPRADDYVRSGSWPSGAYPLTTSLNGMRIGIVGLGRIGQGIARRLEPFGVTIAYASGRQQAAPWRHIESVLALAAWADTLVLCCPGGESTRHLINTEVLDALADGWLVNMSRGSVVDERALCQALKVGSLRGAALDVYEDEPLIDSPLQRLENVVLSPHAGSATVEARSTMLRLTLDNLHAVLAGKPPLTPVI
ncbi:Glyoxylate reductase [Cupriavidus taiwanensis]|nr:Glyoxylate reductase [Cupriavidus taiwanensis]